MRRRTRLIISVAVVVVVISSSIDVGAGQPATPVVIPDGAYHGFMFVPGSVNRDGTVAHSLMRGTFDLVATATGVSGTATFHAEGTSHTELQGACPSTTDLTYTYDSTGYIAGTASAPVSGETSGTTTVDYHGSDCRGPIDYSNTEDITPSPEGPFLLTSATCARLTGDIVQATEQVNGLPEGTIRDTPGVHVGSGLWVAHRVGDVRAAMDKEAQQLLQDFNELVGRIEDGDTKLLGPQSLDPFFDRARTFDVGKGVRCGTRGRAFTTLLAGPLEELAVWLLDHPDAFNQLHGYQLAHLVTALLRAGVIGAGADRPGHGEFAQRLFAAIDQRIDQWGQEISCGELDGLTLIAEFAFTTLADGLHQAQAAAKCPS